MMSRTHASTCLLIDPPRAGEAALRSRTLAQTSHTLLARRTEGLVIRVIFLFAALLCGSLLSFAGSAGSINISPYLVSFGNVTPATSTTQTFVVGAWGPAPVTISQVTLTGAAAYSISGPALPATIADGGSVNFVVTFSPTKAGFASAKITIASNASNPLVTLYASGTGATQKISASPTSLSFGTVTTGSSSTLPVVVTNTGTGNVTVSSAATSGSAFSVAGPSLPTTLGPGAVTTFSVTFAPTAAGTISGTLSVASDATNSPAVSSISATGVKQHTVTLTWSPSPSTGVTGYNVYRAPEGGGSFSRINGSLVSGTTYTDATVEAGQSYYYVVTAENSQAIESADSSQVTALIPTP